MKAFPLELWRVGSVVCSWSSDFRRICVHRKGVLLSDQTFTSPAEALECAGEMRMYFRLIHKPDPMTASMSAAGGGSAQTHLRQVHPPR